MIGIILCILLIISSLVWICTKATEIEDTWDKDLMWLLTGKYF